MISPYQFDDYGEREQRAYERQRGFQSDIAARQAGNALKSGDWQGAAGALYGVGDVTNGLKIQDAAREQQKAADTRRIGGQAASGDLTGARGAALQGGDFDLAKSLADMDDAQKKQLKDQTALIASVLEGLRKMGPEMRAAQWEAAKGQLASRYGIPQAALDSQDISDAGIDRETSYVMSVQEQLAELERQRDNARQQAQFEETRRANRERERQGGARIGLAREAHDARVKGRGGYGVPGGILGSSLPDGWTED